MTFNKGDKVRYVGNDIGDSIRKEKLGKVFTVVKVVGTNLYVEENSSFTPHLSNLEHVCQVPKELFEL